jgi:hypothetical protein
MVILGTTFSQLQCRYLGLDNRETFQYLCSLGFRQVRLGSYWNEIEPIENQFDFSTLDWLLDESHRCGIEVILTVGMKAPRWTEFHFPNWLSSRNDTSGSSQPIDRHPEIRDRTLHFLEQVVDHTRSAPAIKYWQIENEPFARLEITGGRFLSEPFVRQEVERVRSLALPHQKILLTNAITLPAAQFPTDDRAFRTSLALADAVGINVYTKVPIGNSPFYVEALPPFWNKLKQWQQILVTSGKEAWIAEAQAEPWEPNELVAVKKIDYPSSHPARVQTLVTRLTAIGYTTILLWGCEYWYWHQKNGRNSWNLMVQRLLG